MMRIAKVVFFLLTLIWASAAFAQSGESPINIFGYFQTSFQHWPQSDASTTHPQYFNPIEQPAQNSFSLQQLNLFLSKDLARHWRAFINFEILNTFSSQRQWGAFNLEEAWIRYKPSDKFNLKLGLLIPVFNNLNEIKNRTPLLPYIIRPLIYETSFSEFLFAVEEGAPARAFVQASGVIPAGTAKFEYALYVGNSPNINSDRNERQTGIDTTTTFLIGSRIGFRLKNFKIGLSATHENINLHIVATDIARYEFIYNEVPRIRLGGDISFQVRRFSFEGEFITVNYGDISEIRINGEISNDTAGEIDFDGGFYYGTLGYQLTDRLFAYASYWYLKHDSPFVASQVPRLVTAVGDGKIKVPGAGIAFKLNDRITFKGQYASANIKDEYPLLFNDEIAVEEQQFDIFAIAASVFF
jgi:hypothetical protein